MSNDLPTSYQQVIHRSRYARFLPEQHRRETWEETVDRYITFMYKKVKATPNISKEDLTALHKTLGATCDL